MITLANVRDLFKEFETQFDIIAKHYYIGKLDNKQDYSIGVYPLRRNNPVIALGEFSKYDIKSVSVLIHWNKNADDTEIVAYDLYQKLQKLNNFKYRNFSIKNNETKDLLIHFIKMRVAEPVDVGTDNSGVYERVIEMDIYYRKDD